MALVKAGFRWHPLFLGAVTVVTLSLIGSVQWGTAGEATSASGREARSGIAGGAISGNGPAPIISGKRFRTSALFPGRKNSTDVVRTVERNRGTARPMPVKGMPVSGAGLPFLIGSGPEAAPDDQRLPAVAFDGTNYLVVWEDRRSGSTDLYCARVNPDGGVLDPRGIVISAEYNAQGTPAVAFDGENFLVVWDDWRFSMNPNIYGARVSPAGTVLDSITAIPISTAIDGQINPSIAFDGTNYLVVWEDWRSGTRTPDIYCTRVSPSGDVLDSAGVAVSVAAGNQMYPSVTFNGAHYVVVWEDQRNFSSDIYGARVSPSGVLLDADGIAVSTPTRLQQRPNLACDGTNCLVVWEDQRNFSSDIYGARISPSGTVLDPTGIAVSTSTGDQLRPTLIFDGTSYLIMWEDWRSDGAGIYGARVSTDGVLDDVGMIVSDPMSDPGYSCPSLGFDGANYLVAWESYGSESSASTDVYGARVNPTGDVLEPGITLISTETRWQDYPAISFDGTNYFAVWTDYDAQFYDSEIRGRRISDDGVPIGSDVIIAPTGASSQTLPALAFDGQNYLVVWTGAGNMGYGVYGTRIDTSGSLLDPDGFLISTGGPWSEFPAIAFGGTSYLVVWADGRNGNDLDIYGARVDTSGAVLDAEGIPISAQPGWDEFPAVSFDGSNYMVVWDDERSGAPRVHATRVDTSGTVLDPGGIAMSAGGDYEGVAALAFNGTHYLVAWTRVLGEEYDIYGARVTASGTVLDPDGIPVSTPTGIQFFPTVGFDGTNYLVLWSDFATYLDPVDVYGTRVTAGGAVLDPAGVSIGGSAVWVADQNYPPRPAFVQGPVGSVLVAYPAFTGFPYDCNRIWGVEPDWLTGLMFSSAAASGQGGYVTVSWQMAVDVPVSGFQVWRSDSPETGFSLISVQIVQDTRSSFSCVDRTVIPGKTYWYKIVLQGFSVEESYGPFEVVVESIPLAFKLHQTFPNPSNPSCTIRYEVPKTSRVSLRMFDVGGHVVRTLVDTRKEPGRYAELWDGRNDSGETLPSGVYLCQFRTDIYTASEKVVLVR